MTGFSLPGGMRFAISQNRLLLVGLLLVALGLAFRVSVWQVTTPIRFQNDLVNAFKWGRETLRLAVQLREERGQPVTPAHPVGWGDFAAGYTQLYDRQRREHPDGKYELDYPPLRLLVMSLWTRYLLIKEPQAWPIQLGWEVEPETGRLIFAQVGPLLVLNLVAEAAALLAMCWLVSQRCRRVPIPEIGPIWLRNVPPERRPAVCATLAAVALWFNPAMLLDAYGWPQWDVWLLPFYLLAALTASEQRWFLAGLLLATGAMLKGQMLFVLPFFGYWSLRLDGWRACGSLATGFGAITTLITLPWLLAGRWSGLCFGLTLAMLLWRSRKWFSAWFSGALMLPPARIKAERMLCWRVAVLIALALALGAWHGGSFAWLRVGFAYGVGIHADLVASVSYNLAALLQLAGFQLDQPLGVLALPLRLVLATFYLLAVIGSAELVIRALRGNDARFLPALGLPWLLMFALLPQMHERYLLWGAALTAMSAAVSLRLTLLHLFFSLACAGMILQSMTAHAHGLPSGLPAWGTAWTPLFSLLMLAAMAGFAHLLAAKKV